MLVRTWIVAGGLAGLSAVAMNALAAHYFASHLDAAALRAVVDTVQMQAWHGLALLFCAAWAGRGAERGGRLVHAAGVCFLAGTLMFSMGVYAHVLGGVRLPMLAPAGGTTLMLGWGLLAASGLTRAR